MKAAEAGLVVFQREPHFSRTPRPEGRTDTEARMTVRGKRLEIS